jgi:hypothetical protein
VLSQLAERSLGRILPPTIVRGLVESMDAAHMAQSATHRLSVASLFVTRTRMTRSILREQQGHTARRVVDTDAPAAHPAAR